MVCHLAVAPRLVNVTSAMVPVIFLYLNISLFYSGDGWWKAFDTDSLAALANTIIGKSLLINVAQRWSVW
jgi:hypothetical protein